MLTKNEISTLSLSPTKKDFVQIWNELLEVAGRLSERWDPTSTNESDPGIVILKALTGIADKLNYNIDKNTLEAFMPTAAQEDSMRKLCDMLGYNIKYYRSAETTVTIKWYNSNPTADEEAQLTEGLSIPKFTVITNGDQDINYFTTNQIPLYISLTSPTTEPIPCMEGQIVKCESTSDNNIITLSQISDINRFYLPEVQVAENGIFVYNVAANNVDGEAWEKVDNLNIQARGSRVFKFGYDSYEGRPYIEFPEDCSELIKDGLFIYYTRTSGASGNISAKTLTQIELPSTNGWDKVSVESFSVENSFSATSGANIETINQAYNNFKKTIGTFETLVTCRDYMNKIYSMTNASTSKPIVSNILATDIRTDLNRAVTICSCDDAGIFYKETPLTNSIVRQLKLSGSNETVDVEDTTSAIDHFDLILYPFKSYTQIRSNVKDIQEVYDSSFTYSPKSFNDITNALDAQNIKTIAHNLKTPREHDIVSINNYLRLNAIIGTNSKVTTEEGTLLVEKIKIALANAFNMRELDFGEEIPFDSIVDVIENADSRISIVSLVEPALYTTFSVFEGINANTGLPILREYAVASDWLNETIANGSGRFDYKDENIHTFNTSEAKQFYNKLAVRNVLAGRVPLFNYNTTFKHSFSDGTYRVTKALDILPDNEDYVATQDNPFTLWVDGDNICSGQWIVSQNNSNSGEGECEGEAKYTKTYTPEDYANNIITKNPNEDSNFIEIETECKIKSDKDSSGKSTYKISDVTLEEGEFIKFRAPNFTTLKTYPAYVNYHLKLDNTTSRKAVPAEADTLGSLFTDINTTKGKSIEELDERRKKVLDYFGATGHKKTFTLMQKISNGTSGTGEFVIDNPTDIQTSESVESILNKSSFIKLDSKTATISWATSQGESTPAGVGPSVQIPDLPLENTLYIISADVINSIKSFVNDKLIEIESELKNIANDWTISYKFEYVPFEPVTLPEWENFIQSCDEDMFNFTPVVERGSSLWRIYGSGYNSGKYVLKNTNSKLMPFTAGHFGLLGTRLLDSIYVATTLGSDEIPTTIENNEEYKLRKNEYLYIEYTPSTTSEDGTTQEQEPITEVLGEGTIIKPSGFETGLIDSSVYAKDYSSYKEVTFEGIADKVQLFSLKATEQIEIREFAQVVLDSSALPNATKVYVYKNFNDCPELEDVNNEKRSYVLKDGEYVFYTDQHQTEFAYFTSGTEVTLIGDTVLPKFEIIDLAAIFDNGIQEIPWAYINLLNNSGIIFQEFQYITLGPGDTLNELLLTGPVDYLDASWQRCDGVSYTVTNAEKPEGLPKINVSESFNNGNGWEVSSVLELNVSPSNAQTLRNTSKVETSITLYKEANSSILGDVNNEKVTLKAEDSNTPISFKTNVLCQSSSSKINISDLYSNTNNLKSFELKILTEEVPAIIQTAHDKLIPYISGDQTSLLDINTWYATTNRSFATKGLGELWTRVALTYFATDSDAYDNALRLPVNIFPDTYGIFSIYLKYDDNEYLNPDDAAENVDTWIEVFPGVSHDDITVINAEVGEDRWENNKLMLKQGINCIRVNKTMDLFIKTSSSASTTSAIYFDDLRLVDCKPIEYIDSNGNLAEKFTQGLNLTQIGYLDIYSDSLNILDDRIRKKAKKDLTKNALTDLSTIEKNSQANYNLYYKELYSYKDKLEALTTFISAARDETNTLLANDELNDIFNNYIKIHNELEQENKLKVALSEAISVDEVEQQLVELLKRFADEEALKQELITELESLRQKTLSELTNSINSGLPVGDILSDFSENASKDDEYLVSNLKIASVKEINKLYAEQLAELEETILNIADSTARETLFSLWTNANTLYTNIKNLSAATDTSSLISNIEKVLFDYTTEITNLDTTECDIIVDILSRLEDYTNIRQDFIDDVDKVTDSNFKTDIPYLEAVVQAVWPKYIKQEAELFVNTLYSAIYDVANDKSNTEALKKSDRKIITKLINTNAFESLFEKVRDVSSQSDQSDARKKLIETIWGAKQVTSEAKTLMESIILDESITDTHRNVILKQLADKIFNTESVSEKQRLINKLKAELDDVIKIDTQLEEVSAKLIYPHILCAESKLSAIETDQFYSRLAEYISSQKEILVANNFSFSETLTGIATYLDTALGLIDIVLTAVENNTFNTIAEGQWEALESADESATLLEKSYLDLLANLKVSMNTKDEAILLKTCDLIKLLQRDLIVAWKDTTGNWLDSSGKYYKKYMTYKQKTDWHAFPVNDSAVNQKAWIDIIAPDKVSWRDSSGKWRTADGNLVEVNTTCEYSANGESIWTITDEDGNNIDINELCQNTATVKDVRDVFDALLTSISELANFTGVSDNYRDAYSIITLEDQLIADIRAIDKNRDFYWNIPVEANVAIDFNEGDESLNTLMNPAINYDINNINNNFVISKLDINYLTSGLQIARSSRLS